MTRVYLRNGVPGWTLEAQEAALREAGVYRGDAIYRDELSAAAIKKRDPSLLVQRADLLKRTGRRQAETIYVASFYCFALNAVDLLAALAQAAQRNAAVISLKPPVEVPPHPHAAVLAQAAAAFDKGRKDKQTETGRAIGQKAAAEKRKRRTADRVRVVKDDWARPTSEVSTAELAERAGVSVQTLYDHLGRRSTAQLREKRNAAKRKPK